MSKQRNLKYQFFSAIEKHFKENINKHSLKKTGKKGTEVFSYSQRKNLIDLASNFSNWMRENHCEVKQVKDITSQHIQEFLSSKRSVISQKSIEQYQSQFNKLQRLVNSTYKCEVDYHTTKVFSLKNGGGKLRSDMLSMEDYNKMLNTTNQNLRNALVLSQHFGLRCEEIARLRASDFTETHLNIISSKGGRNRQIPIETPTQKEIAKEFIQKVGRICPIQKGSLQQAFNREKKKHGITSYSDFHSCRKAYATERFQAYRKSGMSIQQALNKVSVNLGHSGNGARNDLIKEYLCCPIQ